MSGRGTVPLPAMTLPSRTDPQTDPRGRQRAGWLFVVTAVMVAGMVLVTTRLTTSHDWGDDFAGYLLQARALADGTAWAEVELNGRLLESSDRRVGPDGYPWGVPALLSLAARVVGWDVNGLKVLGFASFVLLSAFHLRLLRQAGLGPGAIAVCGAAVLWQPALLEHVDIIGSDLPFLAVSAVYLSLMVTTLQRHARTRRLDAAWLGTAAFVAAASFAIRSNGAVLLGTTILTAAYCLMTGYALTRRQLILGVSAFAGAALAGYLVFFTLLPDGTAIHIALLVPESARFTRRAQEVVGDMTQFVPLTWLPDAVDHLVVLALGPLALVGVWAMGATGLMLGTVLAAHTLLLLLFPRSDGPRYYFPLLPPLVLLCWFGTLTVWRALAARWPGMDTVRPLAGTLLPVAFAGAALLAAVRATGPSEELAHGPLSPSFAELTSAVRRSVTGDQRVSFFRPRAMRWFSGRQAVTVTQLDHLAQVDAVALYNRLSPEQASYLQPAEAAILGTGQFALVFENADFRLYLRRASGRNRQP